MFLDYILLENTENNMSKNNLPLSTPVSYTHLTLPTNREV